VIAATVTLALLVAGGPGKQPEVKWVRQWDAAVKRAQMLKKPLLVDFWAEWCGWCHRLDQTTYVDPVVVKMSEDFVPVKVNTEGTTREVEVARKYEVTSLPTIAFLSPSGRLILRLNGFQGPGQFPRAIEVAKERATKIIGWEDDLERDPRNAEALSSLGAHLFEQEAYDESREFLLSAVKADRQRPVDERKRTRMLLGIVHKYNHKNDEAESVLKEGLALQPASEYDPKLMYVLARLYAGWGKYDDARAVLKKILNVYAQSPVAEKARETLVALDRKNN
jgi:thioredoxin-like negative regulator of GroEL